MPWVTCTQVVWQFRVISTRICICNSLTRRNSELDREFPSRSLRKSSQQKERAKHSYTERKTEECVQRKTIGPRSWRDACSFLHTRATGDTVRRTWNEVEIRKKFSSRSKHPLRYRKWKTQTDGKNLSCLKANPTTKAENSLSTVGKMKNIVAWLSTSSRVSWLQVWKQMHSLLSLLMSTSWWWEEQPQREVEMKVLTDKLLSWKKKPRLCISNSAPTNSILQKSRELGLNASAGHTWNFSGGKEEGQSGGTIQKGDPHEQNPCAPCVEEQPLEETSWQAGCTSKVTWNLATKCASSSRTWNNVLFACEGARDTEDRMFIVSPGASVRNAEQGELTTHTMDTLRKNTICDLPRRDSANKRVSTIFFFHDLDLFATEQLLDKTPAILLLLYILLKTRRFVCVENGETPQLAKNGKTTTRKMDNSERSNARHSVWLQTFTVNLEHLERCARTFLWKSDLRFGRWSFKSGEHKNGSIVPMLTSAKTKRDLVCAQKGMVTWQQQSTILSEGCESRNNHRYAVVVQVLATQWNPCKTKTSQETENNLRKFQKPSQKPEVIHTYNLLEFGKYCEELSCNHRTTTLHRSETSGIAERIVRRKMKRYQPYYCNLDLGW